MKNTILKMATLALSIALSTQVNAANDIYNRSAVGDITVKGGASRIHGDMNTMYESEIKLAKKAHAKNVILLIGDGMGDSEITAARNFAHGAGGYFKGLDALPFSGHYTHYSLNKNTKKPDYVTDSAASATAWSTGVKSYNGAIGVDVNGKAYTTLIELAKKKGMATGDITTAEIQDATPAALIAHVVHRKCYGPKVTAEKCPENLLENGGLGSISEQLISTRADVTMGGGMKTFEEKASFGEYKDKTLLEQAIEKGFTVVTNSDELQKVKQANQKTPVLGLFALGNMPVRLKGPQASLHGNLEKPVVSCEVNKERTADVPLLADMTRKAIDLLKVNKNGFFLQVEGASIDKQAHKNNPCGQFGETMDLDEAVQVALDFAKKDGNTLVIVTADHAHATQIVYPNAKAPGFTQAVMTADGAPMTISYGNSEDINDAGHTGAQLRVASYGPGALNVLGLTDQTDIFFTISKLLKLK